MASSFIRAVLPRLACRHLKIGNNCNGRYLYGCNKRWVSSGSDLVQVEQDDSDNEIVVLKMNVKPVNACTAEFNNAMTKLIKDLDADEQSKGLILTSTLPNVFSAGLQLTALHGKSYDEIKEYFSTFQTMAHTLFTSRLATVAAINGHAIAGGCVIALCCEYRVMAEGKFHNGLNEVIVGIPMPAWVSAYTVYALGTNTAEKVILSGKKHTPREALQVGLVDQVVPPDDLIQVSKNILSDLIKVGDYPRRLSKERLRKELLMFSL
uniref:Enoyl-CoA delta isomerase 1, mitochondrial-like n=1 Tax=Saccoglossus kowalevskii TaxID=10224 RepID=A0ABM0MMT1_SACKO|nr:PREDICTED: enoyl-CoA delta isomerase 1, mitochondrial-like [Saccoglossus kowalevskii]